MVEVGSKYNISKAKGLRASGERGLFWVSDRDDDQIKCGRKNNHERDRVKRRMEKKRG